MVKKIISRCLTCKRLEGKSYGVPPAPSLPEYRVESDVAFTRVGVDYAGPLFVKNIYSSDKTMYKSYIVIYTCASSRAVHLDLSVDATSETFIRSFLRFISRRGMPGTMVSDNGKTFKSKELKEFCASKGIKWKHIVERSPWWGGFYERLVRSVKRCLKKVLRTARLSYEELLTLLVQIEGVMNSRPLTYLYEDNDQPLTPSHLVLGRRLLTPAKSDRSYVSEELDRSRKASRRQKHLRTVLEHFWKRWQREYLTQLRENHHPRERKGQTVRKGDIVVVQEDNVKRLNWNIGRIIELLKGRDGNTRAVILRTISKDGKVILLN